MGKCKYCGDKAGFFSSKHKECEKKHIDGSTEIVQLVADTITKSGDLPGLSESAGKIKNESFIKETQFQDLLASGFDKAIEEFFEDGVLSEKEEELASKFVDHFGLSQEELNNNGSWFKLVQGSVLREVMEGNIPEGKVQFEGHLPFNFQKNEKLIWIFKNVEFYEMRTRTHYEGGHSGVSLRVAKGVYYRTGAFKGRPVQTTEMAYKGDGLLGITNKHIYFAGAKSFRIRYDKIVTFEPYEDGIGIQKDGVTAKPQIYKNIDGWFCYNLLTNLSQLT
jgi:hypothetical protein